MKIVVLSTNSQLYSTRRLVEAAKERDHDVQVIDHTKCYVDIEQDKPHIYYEGEEVTDAEVVIPRIGASVTKYGAAIVRQFEMRDVYTAAKSIAITRARDKLRSLQLFAKYGVDIPKTVYARQTAFASDIIKRVGGAPLIIKLAEGTHGKGVVLAETSKAAKSAIQAFYSQGVSILVQEYIQESEGSDIRAFVVGGKVVGSMRRQSLNIEEEFRANIHMGGTVENIKLEKEERRLAIQAARVMGLPIAGVDMLRSDRGPLVIEVNASPGLRGIETATDKDIAGKIIEYVEKNAKRKPTKDKVGA